MTDSIVYATPALHDAPLRYRLGHIALVTRLALRCAINGHEWRTERPTRCVRVSSCRVCGEYIGASVSAASESPCRWWRRGAA